MGTPFSENFRFGSAVPGSSERSSQAGAMSCSVRLLGPDLPNCLVVENLPLDMTVLGLKERALGSWPAGMDVPLIGQIKIILMGRFLPDEKPLSECKCEDGAQTAMHLIVRATASKPEPGSESAEKQAGTRCACIIS